jgi:hypothetical protein
MAGHNHIFPKNGIGIFLRGGLDSRISVESTHEFRFSAHAILALRERRDALTPSIACLPRLGKNSRYFWELRVRFGL